MGQRDDLLAGAKRCLVEKGYSRATARDIASAAGANLASIGYHFGSKDNLMNTAVLEAVDEWGDTVEAAVTAACADTPAQRMQVFLDAFFAAAERERALLVASVQACAQAQFAEEIRGPLAEAYGRGRTALAAMVLGVTAEEVGADTARGLGSCTLALVNGFLVQYLLDPESVPTGAQAMEAVGAFHREP